MAGVHINVIPTISVDILKWKCWIQEACYGSAYAHSLAGRDTISADNPH